MCEKRRSNKHDRRKWFSAILSATQDDVYTSIYTSLLTLDLRGCVFVFMETGNFIFLHTHILLFIKVELNTALLMVRFLSTYLAVHIRLNNLYIFIYFFFNDLYWWMLISWDDRFPLFHRNLCASTICDWIL